MMGKIKFNNYFQEMWASAFGDNYTDRCRVDYQPRIKMFRELLDGVDFDSVLECGCNMGHNLMAISEIGNENTQKDIQGIDINEHSIKGAVIPKGRIVLGSIYELPWIDKSFDLVMTAGVLIHIPKENLNRAMKEMHRVSKKYVLCIEHIEKEDRAINYRDFEGREGMWPRNYTKLWKDNFNVKVIKEGDMKDFGVDDGWNFSTSCQYVILEKV
jgi:ubiquinone/menaquinone biosynthesis C-methylase UbiE